MCSGRAREMLRVKIHKTIRGMGFGRRNLEFDFYYTVQRVKFVLLEVHSGYCEMLD